MSNENKKPKFKLGDEVEIVAKHYSGKNLKIGQRAKTKEVVIYNSNSYEFAYHLDVNTSYFWFEDELKLVSQQNKNINKNISEGFIKYKINGDKTKVFLHSKNGDFVGESRRNSIDAKDDKIGVLIATSRALGFSKNTVDDIVNVIFKEKNEEIDFKVGDRVIGVNNVIDGHIIDIKGTVVGIDLDIAVNFDNNVCGHEFGGRFNTPYCKVKTGHGLWVDKNNIKLLAEEDKYDKVEETKEIKKDVLSTPIDTFNGVPIKKLYHKGDRVISFSPNGSYEEFGTVIEGYKVGSVIRFDSHTFNIYVKNDYLVKVDNNLEPIVRQLLKKNDELLEIISVNSKQINELNNKFDKAISDLIK